MTLFDVDPVRAFATALPYTARRHLRVDYDTIPLIRAAAERLGPLELARIVGHGITRHTPANPGALILHRLRREAGALDTTDAEEAPT